MSSIRRRPVFAALAALTLVAAACGSDDDSSDAEPVEDATDATDAADAAGDQPEQADGAEQPTIVVTTSILGDVVEQVVGDQATVVTILPPGADPHDFQASAQEVDQMVSADALVVNGGGLEEGLVDVIDNAQDEGVPTFEALSAVETIEFGEGGHDHHDHGDEEGEHHDEEGEHSDEEGHDHEGEEGHDHDEEGEHKDEEGEHSDEEGHDHEGEEGHDHDEEGEHSDEEGHDHDEDGEHKDEEGHDHDEEGHDHDEDGHEGHDHSGDDPHFWMDPMRMADAVEGMVAFLSAEVAGLDADQLEASAASYIAELEAVDADIVTALDEVPEEQRVLVTNHDAFGYFADRYEFEVAGVIIPGGGTTGNVSAGELAELAEVVEAEGVPAIFSETTASDEFVNVLADEVGDIEVVELYSGSLGEPGSDGDTYLGMVLTNAERISGALS